MGGTMINWNNPCGKTADGEEAFCTTHLAELTGHKRNDLAGRVSRADGFAVGNVDCGTRLRNKLVVPKGVILSLGLDERKG